jgi:hypothetical protein
MFGIIPFLGSKAIEETPRVDGTIGRGVRKFMLEH